MPSLGVLERALEPSCELRCVPRVGEAGDLSRDFREPKALAAAGDQPQDVFSLDLAS